MAHLIDLQKSEGIMQYHFKEKTLLTQALHAPVKLQDKETDKILYLDDGNRRLAQLGHKVLDLVLNDVWFHAGSDRESVNNIVTTCTSASYLAAVARRHGLDLCVNNCVRQDLDGPSPKTLKLAVTALIGAVWLDSDKDITVVSKLVNTLGITQ
ncbi:hypothetical protein LTR64_005303 [Lithohypha guttulata]|uniref:uncharacterized protein n=1 Tax=Lithohypha guttulata TaxID=1690604 RepID=UPI002DDEEA2A|nr:hypothetical protein LTR51_002903 [Lithohypha guttulata]